MNASEHLPLTLEKSSTAAPSSVYIHVPFCRSRCVYCDFVVVLDKYGGHEAYVKALCDEIRLKTQPYASLPKEPLNTVYVGGGTPSLLPAAAYREIFDVLGEAGFFLDENTEITLEANPDDWLDTPECYLDAGFNRISLGVQSLDDGLLKKLSRRHTSHGVLQCIEQLQSAGFHNISVDLMYGLPFQGLDTWQSSLEKVISLQVPHLSIYGLGLHKSTPLNTLVQKKIYPLPDDDITVQMYQWAREKLEASAYEGYEFSNFSKQGFESRHNLAYWENKNWFGFGVAAHGKINNIRTENTPDIKTYIENPMAAKHIEDTQAQQLENYLIFGLRLAKGVDWSTLERQFSKKITQKALKIIEKWVSRGVLAFNNGQIFLLPEFIHVSNSVFLDFIALEEH